MNQELNRLLNRFTENRVRLRKDEKRQALRSWEGLVREILHRVKQRDERFALEVSPSGSYYERAKVKKPDEFDIVLVMKKLELDDQPYDESEGDGLSEAPLEFTTVMIDGREDLLLWQRDQCVNRRGMLKATQVKAVFSRHVAEAISQLGYRNIRVVSQGPAVTLKICNHGREYSVDLTLAIKDFTWPEDAEEWKTRRRYGWPSPALVHQICNSGCHLVAKQPKDFLGPDEQKQYFWRLSFAAAEKKLFLEGGHGEPSSCRKQVLKILKVLREDLHLEPLKSYHLKTVLLYECEDNPHPSDWSFDSLSVRFMGALKRLESCLSQKNCPHYFIKNLNLFERFNNIQRCQELKAKVQDIQRRPRDYLVL